MPVLAAEARAGKARPVRPKPEQGHPPSVPMPPERPVHRVCAESEEDITHAIHLARANGSTVRALGAAGSKNDCGTCSGVVLDLSRCNRVLAVDANLVTVEAGMTVSELNRHLDARGLAIPTQGEWAGATTGGALATGTHGGSSRYGILPTSVHSIRLIGAEGIPVEIRRDSPLFRQAGVSLGLLGIVSAITFACEERFQLGLTVRVLTFRQYLDGLNAEMRASEFCSAVWIPTAGRVISFVANRTHALPSAHRRLLRFGATVFGLGWASRSLHLDLFNPAWFADTTIDWCDRIITPIRNGSGRTRLYRFLSRSWMAAEFAVATSEAVPTLTGLEALLARHPLALTHPVGLRPTAADDFALSPANGRPTFWIDIFYRDHRGFAEALRDFLEGREARCHWGKHIGLSAEHLRRQYAELPAFRAERATLDPEQLFMNRFARRLGL